MSASWIGFDLDGTLAQYHGWEGPEHVGEPIPLMVAVWKAARASGMECRIVTARAGKAPPGESEEERLERMAAIERWCIEHLGEIPVITACKDYGMVLLYDDRCITVEKNTGRILTAASEVAVS